jgi:hypothetical protein
MTDEQQVWVLECPRKTDVGEPWERWAAAYAAGEPLPYLTYRDFVFAARVQDQETQRNGSKYRDVAVDLVGYLNDDAAAAFRTANNQIGWDSVRLPPFSDEADPGESERLSCAIHTELTARTLRQLLLKAKEQTDRLLDPLGAGSERPLD